MKLPTFILSLLPCLFQVAAAAESATASTDVAMRTALQAPALDALRKGDTATADALLKAAARGVPNSAPWHLDYGNHLISAAIDLKDRDQYKLSTDYFHRAAAELLAAVEGAGAPTDAIAKAQIYHQLGFIARVADGDQKKANEYFKATLALDINNVDARASLRRTKDGRVELEKVVKAAGTTTITPDGG